MPLPDTEPNVQPARPTGLRYDQLHRLGSPGSWRVGLGIPMLAVGFVATQLFAAAIVVTVVSLTSGGGYELGDGDPAKPGFLAVVNLSWALMIAVVFGVAAAAHGLKTGWVCSVVGRLRWRWMLVCAAIAAVALGLTIAVASVLPDQGAGSIALDGPVNDWTSTLRDFALVVLLLTPLQAAGEEFVFRGYLAQAFGGLLASVRGYVGAAVAVVVPSVLFALAHGVGQDVPIFVDRLAFGLVAGTLVLLTGGLEAGIAMHVLNNFAAFGMALTFGDMTEALTPSDGTWWALPVTLTQSLSYLLLTWWAARRLGIARRTESPARVG